MMKPVVIKVLQSTHAQHASKMYENYSHNTCDSLMYNVRDAAPLPSHMAESCSAVCNCAHRVHMARSLLKQLGTHSLSTLGCCSCRGSGSSLRSIGCCCCEAEYSSGVNRRRWVGAVKSLPPASKALCDTH